MKTLASDFERPGRLRPTTPRLFTRKRRVVLFALFERGRPTHGLMRAFAFARILQAELHVMRVLCDLTRLDMQPHERDVRAATQSMGRTLRSIGSTRSWLRDLLGEDAARLTHVTAASGDFVERVAEQAKHDSVALIVTPAREASIGAAGTLLAYKCNIPVLVARAASRDETIVAATDLEVPGFPVLRAASAMGHRLQAPLITIHNVQPVSARFNAGATWRWAGQCVRTARRLHRPKLAEISANLHASAIAIVRRDTDPVAAILDEARTHNADLVVVGAKRRHWLGRSHAASVATQVVDRAHLSVLVTPIRGASSSGAAATR